MFFLRLQIKITMCSVEIAKRKCYRARLRQSTFRERKVVYLKLTNTNSTLTLIRAKLISNSIS